MWLFYWLPELVSFFCRGSRQTFGLNSGESSYQRRCRLAECALLAPLSLFIASCPACAQLADSIQANPAVDLYGDSLPAGAVVRCGTLRYRHPGWYKHVLFVPGTHQIVVSTKDNAPKIWDVTTGKKLREFPHRGKVACLKLMPGTSDVAMLTTKVNGTTRTVQCWFTIPRDGGGRIVTWKEAFTEHSVQFAVSPDGEMLVTATYHGTLRFRDLKTGAELRAIPVVPGQIHSVAWSPNGKHIAVAGARAVAIVDATTDGEKTNLAGIKSTAQVVKFSHDGSMLAVGCRSGGPATLWDPETGKKIRQIGDPNKSYYREGLCFSADDTLLFVPNNSGKQVEAFEVATGRSTDTFVAKNLPPRSIAVSDDGKYLASVGSESQIAVWDLKTHEQLSERFSGHPDHAGDLMFTKDGRQLFSAGMDGSLRIWDVQSGRQTARLNHDRWVSGLDVSGSGQLIASIGLDDSIRIWKSGRAEPLFSVTGHGSYGGNGSCEIGLTQDSKEVLSFGADFNLMRHSTLDGKLIRRTSILPAVLDSQEDAAAIKGQDLNRLSMGLGKVQFNADRTRIVLNLDGRVYALDTSTGKRAFVYAADDRIECHALSPDGTLLAVAVGRPVSESASSRKQYSLQIIDAGSMSVVREVDMPNFGFCMKFAHDSRILAVCCNAWRSAKSDASVRLLDAKNGRVVNAFRTGNYQIGQLAFSEDDKLIATSLSDSQILIWDVTAPPAPQ